MLVLINLLLQVAISLAACIYFLNEKTKSLGRACIIGWVIREQKQLCINVWFSLCLFYSVFNFCSKCRFGALVAGWFSGSLVVPNIPSTLLPPTWTLELLTSLVAFLFLFLSCTFLKWTGDHNQSLLCSSMIKLIWVSLLSVTEKWVQFCFAIGWLITSGVTRLVNSGLEF